MESLMKLKTLRENIQDIFIPVYSIVMYKNNTGFYAEEHPLVLKDGEFIFSSGIPIQAESIMKLVASLKKNANYAMNNIGRIPRELLFICVEPGNERMIWYREPRMTTINIVSNRSEDSFPAELPGLIFAFDLKDIQVFVHNEKGGIPNDNTYLFHSIFPNTKANEFICMGNAEIKKSKNVSEIMQNVETAFFNSWFTGYGIPYVHKVGTFKDYNWKLIKKDKKVLPACFVAVGKQLKTLYNEKS